MRSLSALVIFIFIVISYFIISNDNKPGQSIFRSSDGSFTMVTAYHDQYITDNGTLNYIDSLSCIRKKQVQDQYNKIKEIENKKCE